MNKTLRDCGVAAGICLFYVTYLFVPPVRRTVDLAIDPAVSGLTMLYSKASTFIAGKTKGKIRLGLIDRPVDAELQARVGYAKMANERQAGTLIELASNKRHNDRRREQALAALLQFSDTADWIQPLLNALPKGGLVSLYERETPILDALFARVRQEGGIRQPLVRDYAELVFSFLLQVPDDLPRSHAFRWLSDVLPDQALGMIISRIPVEKDVDVRKSIEEALLEVRVAPKSDAAAAALVGFYRDLPWETLKLPLAVVLARLGDKPAKAFLQQALRVGGLSPEEKAAVTLSLSGTPYPAHIDGSADAAIAVKRAVRREQQKEAALIKRDRLARQEKLQQEFLSKALDPQAPPYVGVKPSVPVPPAMSKSISMTVPADLTLEVIADTNLYRGPDEGREAAALSTGTVVHVRAESMSAGRKWYQIDTDGEPRWIPAANVTKPLLASELSETPEEGAFLEILEEDLPVYAQPAADSQLLTRLARRNIVHVLGSTKKAGERWFEIELKAGESGWIRGDLNLRLAGAGEE